MAKSSVSLHSPGPGQGPLKLMAIVFLSLAAFYAILFYVNNETNKPAPVTTLEKYLISLAAVDAALILMVFMSPTGRLLRLIELIACLGGVTLAGLCIDKLKAGAAANFGSTTDQKHVLDQSYASFFVAFSGLSSLIVFFMAAHKAGQV